MGDLGLIPELGRSPGEGRLPTPVFWSSEYIHWGFLDGVSGKKNPPANAGDERDVALISGLERITWRRKWQPTPVFLPGKCHRQRSLVGYNLWSHRVRHDRAQAEHKHS